MDVHSVVEGIASVHEAVTVRMADSPDLLREAYRLRHQVYCVERSFEAGGDGLEIDPYDAHAPHAVAIHRASGEVLGTVRLVLSIPDAGRPSMPIQEICDPSLLAGLPLAATGEISRFALSKSRRADCAGGTFLRMALIRGLFQLAHEEGLSHWCAVMERSLLRLLRPTGIQFNPIGPLVEYHGIRQPCWASIAEMAAGIRREQPAIWDFVTDGGRHAGCAPIVRLAA